MLRLDGAMGEGGGQILRSALTLSLLRGQPFEIRNIRANRRRPGLSAQHLVAVHAAQSISRAQVEGAQLGSAVLRFHPGEVKAGHYGFKIETAGSATLVLQTIFLPLSLTLADSLVTIEGGTHVPWSPPFEYLARTWLPAISDMGFHGNVRCVRAGFFPRGGGSILAEIRGNASPVSVDWIARGPLQRLWLLSASAGLPGHVAERQARQAFLRLEQLGVPCESHQVSYQASSPGSFVFILPDYKGGYSGFSALGAKGKFAEAVADEALDQLEDFLSGDVAVDPYLADQILLPLSLAPGPSRFSTTRITQHLMTNASVVETFETARVEILGELGGPGRVRVIPVEQAG